ncbi:hypothetical protein EV645_7236 [Kribbella rubisoli]|uniref:Uncharacterized protein n=1 Tax=Kribbella rubisoli TaxID=3075929 RepID=A0A4Q7W208_9ACTN|nr:hypothetical protein [Kribbella rubisoli]RZU03210.1 hypothetical protein EV645_7236 [Kribbella rubisoli]
MCSKDAQSRYFGADFLSAHRKRHGRRPPQERPTTYDIAVEEEYSGWRQWLDEQLAQLPSDMASELAHKIWGEDHFWPVIFELAAGAELRQQRRQIAYEQEWDGLTPDWTVVSDDGSPAAFVEVHTDSPPQDVYRRMRGWYGLVARIRQIPVPVLVTLPDIAGLAKPPDARTAKRIAQDLRQRLSPFSQGLLFSHGYTFAVRDKPLATVSGGRLHAEFVPPSSLAGVVTAERLVQRIEEKVRRYEKLATTYDVPLVIAVGAHKFSGLELKHLDSLLAGAMTTTFQFSAGDTFVGSKEINLGHPPRWFMPRALSAVMWIDNVFPFRATMRPNDRSDGVVG